MISSLSPDVKDVDRTIERPLWERLLLVIIFGAFVLYYSLCCFKVIWMGDFMRHIAAVHALYENFRHPMHEAMRVEGKYTEIYTPLILAAAALGKLFHLTEYRALQMIGIFNLTLYAFAIVFYFRKTSPFAKSALPPIFFLIVSLFLRNKTWYWSSETSFDTLMFIQAYPSLLAWSLALFLFGLFEDFLSSTKPAKIIVISVLLFLLIRTHPITASWVISMICIRLIYEIFDKRMKVPVETLILPVVWILVAFGLATLWPYAGTFTIKGYLQTPEGSPFGAVPFSMMGWLYLLAIPSVLLLYLFPSRFFIVAGFFATFLIFSICQLLHIEYANRYVFFMSFFAQVLVAEAASYGVISIRREAKSKRLALWFFLIAAIVPFACVLSPAFRASIAAGTVLGPLKLWAQPSSAEEFYAVYGPLRPYINGDSTILVQEGLEGYQLAATTGARSAVVVFGFYVPDFAQRSRDVARFLTPNVSESERQMILKRHGVTHILLFTSDNANVLSEIARQFGPVIFENSRMKLLEASSLNQDLGR